jgi:hypothetical protein
MPVQLPNWLLRRFNAVYHEPPHYESSYYGPINMLLTTYFPAMDGYLVKPQARLRQPPSPGARTSIDSTGQTVGTRSDDGNPDFLVSKGSPTLDADVPLLIYEVKRHDVGDAEAAHQIDRYIEWGMQYLNHLGSPMGRMRAVLVIGSKSKLFMLDWGPQSQAVHAEYDLDTTGDEILAILQNIRDGQ